MAAVAVETALDFEHRPRTVLNRAAELGSEATRLTERKPTGSGEIEPWELHSELVLVCPEVSERARELLPERDPDAFLSRLREPASPLVAGPDAVALAPSLSVAIAGYLLWRVIETARSSLVAVGGVVALALLAEVLH
jgi:hypothetical protein